MEIKDNFKEWDLEKIKAKIVEIVKYYWGNKNIRRGVWLLGLGAIACLITIQMMIYVIGVVFWELVKLIFKIFGVHL